MDNLFTLLLTLITFFVSPSTAYGPYEVQKFEYYVSQSPSRLSYSSFTFYDQESGICTECKYKGGRSYGYESSGPLPTEFTSCDNKDVRWKYQAAGQTIYVEFGYWQRDTYGNQADWVKILANGTVIPTACAAYGYSGYLCAPRETRYLTDYVIVI